MTGNVAPSSEQHGLDVVDEGDYGFDRDFSREQSSQPPASAPAAHRRSDMAQEPALDLGDIFEPEERRREPAVEVAHDARPVDRRHATQSAPHQQASDEAVQVSGKVAPPQGGTNLSRLAKHKWNILAGVVAVSLCGAVLVSRLPSGDVAAPRASTAPAQPQPVNQSGPFEQRVQSQQVQVPVVETLQLDQPYPAEPVVIPEPSQEETEQVSSVQPVGDESHLSANAIAQSAVDTRTEEERYYDNMAAAAGNTGQVATAQASLQPVQQLLQQLPVASTPAADARFGEVSAQLSRTSADLLKVLETVQQVKSELATLQQQVKSDSGKTSAMALRLDNMSNQITAFEKATNQKLQDVSKAAVKAAMSALAKGSTKSDKLVLTGGSMVSTSVPAKPQVAPRQVVPAKPQEPARVIAKGPSSACEGKPISQVWSVKGVSTAAGFIRRETDGFGFMVNKDSDVPGFGKVLSFDMNNRDICTTSGRIVRR